MQKGLYLLPCTKLNIKWVKDLNIRPNILNLVKKKVRNRHEGVIPGLQGSDSLTLHLVLTPHSPLTQCSLWQSQETSIIVILSGIDSPQGKAVS